MRAIAVRMAVAVGLLVALAVPQATAPGTQLDRPQTMPGSAVDPPAAATDPAAEAPSHAAPTADAETAPAVDAETAPGATLATAIQPGAVNRTSLHLRATYNVISNLDYDTRVFGVDARIQVTNTSGGPIDRVELNTIAARLGSFRLRLATVDGRAVRLTRSDQTLIVPLGGVLPVGQTALVRVAFRSVLRTGLGGSDWMFTRANGIVSVYRWIPWISRRTPFSRPNHGDPFVTPVSPEVRVRIRTDRAMTIATNGDRIAVEGLAKTYVARNVRDFTFTASTSYRSVSTRVGNTSVTVVYRAGAPAAVMLSAARRALARMEALVGPYPYPTFRVIQSSGGFGMESPGSIWIPTGVGSGNVNYLVHHETAHQWFYSLVGNDQAREPFTDEAAADFLARFALGQRRSSRCGTARLDLSIYAYSSGCYYEVIYIQGGNFLDGVRQSMGGTAFWRGLRAYIAAHRFGLAPTKSLLDTLDAHTPLNLVPRFRARFPRLY
jgi:hypothetical protein